jgi:PAS domain S-box-containing protein
MKGYETGAVDYLPVPVVPEMLRAQLRVLADLHRKTNQLTRWNAELEKSVHARTEELEASAVRLRASEERFRSLAERMPHLVWESSANATATYLSPRWYQYTGGRPGEYLSQGWRDVVHPDDLGVVVEAWRVATEAGTALDYECRLRRHDGVFRWFQVTGEAVTLSDGRVDKWVGTCTDVEERRRAEESLREADRRKDEFLAMLAHETFLLAEGTRLWRSQPSFPADIGFAPRNILLNFAGALPLANRLIDYNFLDIAWAVRVEMTFYFAIFLALLLGRTRLGTHGFGWILACMLILVAPMFVVISHLLLLGPNLSCRNRNHSPADT